MVYYYLGCKVHSMYYITYIEIVMVYLYIHTGGKKPWSSLWPLCVYTYTMATLYIHTYQELLTLSGHSVYRPVLCHAYTCRRELRSHGPLYGHSVYTHTMATLYIHTYQELLTLSGHSVYRPVLCHAYTCRRELRSHGPLYSHSVYRPVLQCHAYIQEGAKKPWASL